MTLRLTILWVLLVASALVFGLCGCSIRHGDYKTTTVAGGMYERVSTGYGETVQLNLLWIPVYSDY